MSTNGNHIPLSRWGKEHWSTFAYVAHWCAEYGTKGFAVASDLHRRQMRVDPRIHPALAHSIAGVVADGGEFPTRLADGVVSGHDDYSCVKDAEAAGLIEWRGTGINPVLYMTDAGLRVAAKLAEHKTRGGSFGNFRLPEAAP